MTKEFGSMRRADVDGASRLAAQAVIDAARRLGLEDVAVATIHSPGGELLLAGAPPGLVRGAHPDEPPDGGVEGVGEKVSPRGPEGPRAPDPGRRPAEGDL